MHISGDFLYLYGFSQFNGLESTQNSTWIRVLNRMTHLLVNYIH